MRNRGLRDVLAGEVPPALLEDVPNRFDVIGDIAIVALPPSLKEYRHLIASAIAGRRGNITTVLNKSGKVGGDHRIPEFEILLGDSTLTTHAEYGYRYRLNVREVFFNSRLGFERRRVMAQVNPGENILVPFCGVGPFAIPAASRGARVVAVEKNPAACKWLAENIRLNNVRVDILCADASVLPFCLKTGFDRLIVPTPYGMDRFFDLLSPLLRPGGFMHFYTFGVEGDVRVRRKEFAGKGYEVRQVRRCGNVAAGVSRWVFDLRKHIEQE